MYSKYSAESRVISPTDPSLHVNGIQYEIPRDCGPEQMLIDFLRDILELKGSKVSCREAACGACIVCVTYKHPGTGEVVSRPVNSCLTPLYSTIGWHVTTVEGLGNKKDGYHPIQSRLADNYGSQCGYCSPGFVMSMFSQLLNNPKPTEAEVEHFFDGNICRCTGYRPILDSMKTFAKDCKAKGAGCLDIEDLQACCRKADVQKVPTSGITPVARGWRGQRFYNPGSLDQLLELLHRMRQSSYRLLVGNTSAGVFKDDAQADFYVNIRNVPELYEVKESKNGLEIGACLSIADLMDLFRDVGSRIGGLKHLVEVAKHYEVVGSQAVRRNGSWAGNLMMKHDHPGMGSDIFITMEASKAMVKIAHSRSVKEYTLTDFLQLDMRGQLIVGAVLPAMSTKNHVFKSFKVTQRVLHSHAYVNAAFHFAIDKRKKHSVTEKPSILYGGISGKFNHATKTENYLQNKSLVDPAVVSGALEALQSEVVPMEIPTLSSPEHRRTLAANLLYKFILAACADAVEPAQASGGLVFDRPAQHTEVSFAEEMQGEWLGKAMPKQEARAQTAGEAVYVNDYKAHKLELYAAFVLAPEAPAKLQGFVTDEAEKVPGYRRIVTAEDMKDKYVNSLAFPMMPMEMFEKEEILASEKISYSGQPLAIVLANTQWAADEAASLVEVQYEQTDEEPLLAIRDAVARSTPAQKGEPHIIGSGDFEEALAAPGAVRVEGEILSSEQTHFPIENLTAFAEITEEGVIVSAPHQWVETMALVVARMLRRPVNEVRAISPRVGGGFGGKINMSDLVAAAVSLCADISGAPVRISLTTSTVMRLTSKRGTKLLKYRAACDTKGRLLAVDWDLHVEVGYVNNVGGLISHEMQESMDMGFYAPNRKLAFSNYRTNKPCSTFVRSPGPAPAALGSLLLMDHLAHAVGIDPIQFKRDNLYQPDQSTDMLGLSRKGDSLILMWDQLYEKADIKARLAEVEKFNKANRYRKRGLDMSAASYFVSYNHFRPAVVKLSVLQDGSVSVYFSASEIGQGITVKVAQAVATALNIDINLVKMKPTDSQMTPNGNVTGGSIASEWCCRAAMDAAKQLNDGFEPVRQADPENANNWPVLVQKAAYMGCSLTAIGTYIRRNDEGKGAQYYTNGICAVEAEVDILTGVYQMRRVDLMVDVGKSLNPGVDIGQIEGAFVFGMGYCLTERTIYDPDSGKNLCDGTWNYKVPQAADTPRDFRVHLLEKSSNPSGLLNTRAIGEPPVCLAPVCITAIKRAIEAYRRQEGKPDKFLQFDMPLNPEKVLTLCEVGDKDRRLNPK
ncbi:hypothetical protein BOX15_Mlig031927g1 [Macrostomum lignano]|uniref:FAD-binding PCMH-type domain-containing protein n=1 Tax=Macrostomum lignano TaxID=282301 RepID=A0A267FJD6_9PLAT|nr:hypothetical protein BOX15_Mlig031927g1 [Macrostomum lignano]